MAKGLVLATILSGTMVIPVYAESFPVKVMTYNVLLGFHTYPNQMLEKYRLENAKKIIAAEDPDILLLEEAFYATKNATGLLLDYQKELNYPFVAIGTYGDFQGNVILSKYPVVNKQVLPLGQRTALRVQLEVCAREPLTIDVFHLSPFISEKEKSQQLEMILLKDTSSYIVGGDFNSLSPDDHYKRQDVLPDFLTFYGLQGVTVADNWLTCGAIKTVKKYNLHDSLGKFEYTYPTDIIKKDKKGAIRIDYLFHSADIKSLEAYGIKTEAAERASDHYPFVAVFLVG